MYQYLIQVLHDVVRHLKPKQIFSERHFWNWGLKRIDKKKKENVSVGRICHR